MIYIERERVCSTTHPELRFDEAHQAFSTGMSCVPCVQNAITAKHQIILWLLMSAPVHITPSSLDIRRLIAGGHNLQRVTLSGRYCDCVQQFYIRVIHGTSAAATKREMLQQTWTYCSFLPLRSLRALPFSYSLCHSGICIDT